MSARIFGILIIVLGALALAYGGFRYAYRDNVANVGPVHVNVQKHETVFIPPLLGALAIAGGIALLATKERHA
jgi:hypothetical protein